MLLTLDLIVTNVYNSVEAPTQRGFSYIEIWLIGIQIPILVAIFEYGILLAMKKYYQPNKKTSEVVVFNRKIITTDTEEMNMKKIEITMDKWSFIGTLSFIIIFNIIYWITAIF